MGARTQLLWATQSAMIGQWAAPTIGQLDLVEHLYDRLMSLHNTLVPNLFRCLKNDKLVISILFTMTKYTSRLTLPYFLGA